MGRVYRGRIEGPAGASKLVAVKVMHAHLCDDDDFVKMFLDEMRVAMALDHRNIVHTFDADHSGDEYFLVMELVEGCSLRQLLAKIARSHVALPVDIAVFIAMEISAALDFAHRLGADARRAGVLHRDVSPSNILLSREGDVKLTDFGVAKAAGGRFVTSANLVRGKRQYMSPEQARGEASQLSDIYSLGAVLYEMTTMQVMPRPSAYEGLQHATLPPAPRGVRDSIPETLSTLVLRCVEPEPSERISDAAALRSALASVAFELKRDPEMGVDPHARLRRFLAEHMPASEPTKPEGAAKKEMARLANAVLEQVRAVETDPDFHGAAEDASAADEDALTWVVDAKSAKAIDAKAAGTRASPTVAQRVSQDALDAMPTREAPTREAPTPAAPDRGRGRLLLLSLALMVSAAAAFLWLSLSAPDAPQPRASSRALALSPPVTSTPDLHAASASPDAAPEMQTTGVVVSGSAVDAGVTSVDRGARPRRKRAARYGTLDINSVPWTRVYVDGRYRGETPLQRLRLRAGGHTIRLVSPTRKVSKSYRVRVVANQRRSRVFTLPPK